VVAGSATWWGNHRAPASRGSQRGKALLKGGRVNRFSLVVELTRSRASLGHRLPAFIRHKVIALAMPRLEKCHASVRRLVRRSAKVRRDLFKEIATCTCSSGPFFHSFC
jgi:hypothetical protein